MVGVSGLELGSEVEEGVVKPLFSLSLKSFADRCFLRVVPVAVAVAAAELGLGKGVWELLLLGMGMGGWMLSWAVANGKGSGWRLCLWGVGDMNLELTSLTLALGRR